MDVGVNGGGIVTGYLLSVLKSLAEVGGSGLEGYTGCEVADAVAVDLVAVGDSEGCVDDIVVDGVGLRVWDSILKEKPGCSRERERVRWAGGGDDDKGSDITYVYTSRGTVTGTIQTRREEIDACD